MVKLMKKNTVSGIIPDVLCSGGAVLLAELVFSLIEKRPFPRIGAGSYGSP